MSRFLREPPSVRIAASVIVTATLLITVVGGALMRLLDGEEYPSIGVGMWWALQTVTTIGYGDVTPEEPAGRIVAAFVMLEGVALLTITIAVITSTFVARAAREREDAEPRMTNKPRCESKPSSMTWRPVSSDSKRCSARHRRRNAPACSASRSGPRPRSRRGRIRCAWSSPTTAAAPPRAALSHTSTATRPVKAASRQPCRVLLHGRDRRRRMRHRVPVSDDYEGESSVFSGTVNWVQIDLSEDAEDADHLITPEERLRVAMARQE
jgi:voltage-gated potassium channel